MISVCGLSKRIGHRDILRNLDFAIEGGRFVTVFGPNGAGKTTLLRILSGLMRPTSGEVRLDGRRLTGDDPRLRGKLGVLSHKSYLYENLTARENLLFYGRMYGVADLPQVVDRAIDDVGLSLFAQDPVRTFSRGMEQRLALARAVLHNPEILLLDEPYTGLDQQAREILDRRLRSLRGQGATVIMVSHDFGRGLSLSDEFMVLNRGSLVARGNSGELTPAGFEESFRRLMGEGT